MLVYLLYTTFNKRIYLINWQNFLYEFLLLLGNWHALITNKMGLVTGLRHSIHCFVVFFTLTCNLQCDGVLLVSIPMSHVADKGPRVVGAELGENQRDI